MHIIYYNTFIVRFYTGSVNASVLEDYVRDLTEEASFPYKSTVDLINLTDSYIVFSKATGSGDLLSKNPGLIKGVYRFSSLPTVHASVEIASQRALVNFYRTTQTQRSEAKLPSEKRKRLYPERGIPKIGSQVGGLAFVYDKSNTTLLDADRSPGRIFFNFEKNEWHLENVGSNHSAIENTDKMEVTLRKMYSPSGIKRFDSSFARRCTLRLRALLCENDNGILRTFPTNPFAFSPGLLEDHLWDHKSVSYSDVSLSSSSSSSNSRSSSSSSCGTPVSKKDCDDVFVLKGTRNRCGSSEGRSRQYKVESFKTSRPDKPEISISAIRKIIVSRVEGGDGGE